MLDWLKNPLQANTEPAQKSAVVRVIGDRFSGKTTYMAALARWPNADAQSPVQNITAIGENGEELVEQARDILEQGLELEPTPMEGSLSEVKDYSLSITLKNSSSLRNWSNGSRVLTLNVSCKDYSGEFFSDLIYQSSDPKLRSYMEDCLEATGIVMLIDGTSNRKDAEYANGLKKFLEQLDRKTLGDQKRQIALVLTKCEQSELWVNRHRPTFLASARFPSVYHQLLSWQDMGAGQIDCFTTSAFGMVGTRYPRPNAEQLSRGQRGIKSVIHDPKCWKPFGLVAPIHWLCTSERHSQLDEG
jgi:hypothetical protein